MFLCHHHRHPHILVGCDRLHNVLKQLPFEALAFINITYRFCFKSERLLNMTILTLALTLI